MMSESILSQTVHQVLVFERFKILSDRPLWVSQGLAGWLAGWQQAQTQDSEHGNRSTVYYFEGELAGGGGESGGMLDGQDWSELV